MVLLSVVGANCEDYCCSLVGAIPAMRWVHLHTGMTQFEVVTQVTYGATVMNVLVFVIGLQINSHAVAS